MKTVHVIFGTERLLQQYVTKHNLQGQYVIMATHPELLEGIVAQHGPVEVVAVRYPDEVWTPPSFACGKRVKETEALMSKQLVEEELVDG